MRSLLLALLLSACTFDQAGLDMATGSAPDAGASEVDAEALSTSLTGEPRGLEVEPSGDAWPYTAPERHALLTLANTASLATLDVDAALDQRAAANIIAHRLGPDHQSGTGDDDPFDDLDELDAVKYVGMSTLDKLLAYAYALGMIE
jgi:DNA uptake protein ComE-like DNA-binding protein